VLPCGHRQLLQVACHGVGHDTGNLLRDNVDAAAREGHEAHVPSRWAQEEAKEVDGEAADGHRHGDPPCGRPLSQQQVEVTVHSNADAVREDRRAVEKQVDEVAVDDALGQED